MPNAAMSSPPPGPATQPPPAPDGGVSLSGAVPVLQAVTPSPPPSPSPFPPVAVYVTPSTSAALTGNTLGAGVAVGAVLSFALLLCLLSAVRKATRSWASASSRGGEIPETLLGKASAEPDEEQAAEGWRASGARPQVVRRSPVPQDGFHAADAAPSTRGSAVSSAAAAASEPGPPKRKVRRPKPPPPPQPQPVSGPPAWQPSGAVPDACNVTQGWWNSAVSSFPWNGQQQAAEQPAAPPPPPPPQQQQRCCVHRPSE